MNKGERKLRLVSGPPQGTAGGGDEPPFGDDELAAAEALRDALEHGDEPLALALRAAARPDEIDDGDLEAILARALGDAEAPATRLEQAAAERLRDALEGEQTAGNQASDEIALAGALRAAHAPGELAKATNEALVEAALDRAQAAPPAGARVIALADRRTRARRIAPITMAALAGVAALAASVLLFFGRAGDQAPPSSASRAPAAATVAAEAAAETVTARAQAALIRARSTQDLFDAATPFPRSGEESARIDRIASSRAADLRQNRFAAWGVR